MFVHQLLGLSRQQDASRLFGAAALLGHKTTKHLGKVRSLDMHRAEDRRVSLDMRFII
jgi:hypothetical protein